MCRKTKRKMWTSVFNRRLLLLCLLLSGAAPAFAEYFVIKDYAVQVQFEPDGKLNFTETIAVEFLTERHGIFRAIPLVNYIDGERKELIITDIQVEGWPFTTSRENGNLMLKIGDADRYVNGRQIYVIRYRVENGLNFFKTHAEFYWDLLGISWEVPVEKFRFDLVLPAGLALTQNDVRLYSGQAGSTASDVRFDLAFDAGAVHVYGETQREFAPHEAVTAAIRLPKDTFPQPDPWDEWFRLHGLLLLPGALLSTVLGLLFYSRNRLQTIMVEYQPPLDISPAVAGGFIDHVVDNNDILALIPLLADRGYLEMEFEEETTLWVFKSRNLRFIKKKDAGPDLMPFERRFFEALFSYGDVVELDQLKDKFYTHLNKIRSQVKKWIETQEWYEPDQRTNRFISYGAAAICIVTGFISINRDNLEGFLMFGAAGVIFLLSRFFRQRNEAGNRMYKRLEGFRRFIVKAERPVLERLLRDDPKYFDKTLPYAVAFGEVKRWASQFDGLLQEPPNWYHTRGFGPGVSSFSTMDAFSTQFSQEINQIGSVFSSSPSSSSGGGGGSSGGGSGGGGGGSW